MSIENESLGVSPGLALDMGRMPEFEGYTIEPADAVSEDGLVEKPAVVMFGDREIGEFKVPEPSTAFYQQGQNLPASGLIFERRINWKR